jgi:drug/metabolite transporter (DMT)-like permease
MTPRKAELLLLMVTVLWGGTFALVKNSVDTISPWAFVLMRFLLAAIVTMVIWPSAVKSLRASVVWRGIAIGTVYGTGFLLQTIGLTESSASGSAFITSTSVIFVPLVAWLLWRRPIAAIHGLSIAIVILGLWLFTRPDVHGFVLGDLLTLASAAMWGLYIVLLDRWTPAHLISPDEQQALVLLQFLITIVLSIGGLVATDGLPLVVPPSWDLVLALGYCSIVATVLATTIQTRYQSYTHPVRAGLIFSVEPISAAILAVFVFQEVWTMHHTLGAAVLLFGVVLSDVVSFFRVKVAP